MKAFLQFPPTIKKHPYLSAAKYDLTISKEHVSGSYGRGVLLLPNGQLLDGFLFRRLSTAFEVTLFTSDAGAVCRALGLPEGEMHICEALDEEGNWLEDPEAEMEADS